MSGFNAGVCAYMGSHEIVLLGRSFGEVLYIRDSDGNVTLFRIADFVRMFDLPPSFTMRVKDRHKVPGHRDCWAKWHSIREEIGRCSKNQYMDELACRTAPEVENNGIRIERKSKLLDAFIAAKNEDVPKMIADFVDAGRMCNVFARKYGIEGVTRTDVENFTALDFVDLMKSYGMAVVDGNARNEDDGRTIEVSRSPDGTVRVNLRFMIKECAASAGGAVK